MPEKKTIERAKKDKSEGKAASTQAGEFVHEEIEHVKEGKHGARSSKQAIAIGLSKARRAGVKLPAPKKGTASEETRHKAQADNEAGASGAKKSVSRVRSRATSEALKKEGHSAASPEALSRQAKTAAAQRTVAERSAAARRAARTKSAEERSAAAKKVAETRAENAPAKRTTIKRSS
ncbi:MAG TPA: DUF6496 domain-containing protein [Thermoanaerobaculia bacterium]|jgi:hypothetical protein|nr:DUF6496 domain-containing protein [Thermoanaerobaculia bacterium]